MKLLSLCLGHPEKLPGKSYKTGINKMPMKNPVMIDVEGLVGDAVCNTKYHGGPEQAILLEGSLTLDWWRSELGRDLPDGTFGENLVIEGLDNRDVAAGDCFRIGAELVLQATSARTPCATLAAKMGDPTFVKAYRSAARPGIYCRVLAPGFASAGDAVEFSVYQGTRVSIPELLAKFGKRLGDDDRQRFLSAPIHADMREAIEAGKPAKF